MTAVLAAAAIIAAEIVVVLACVAAMLWAALGPQDWRTVVWLAVMFVTVTAAGVALEWLGKRRRGGAR